MDYSLVIHAALWAGAFLFGALFGMLYPIEDELIIRQKPKERPSDDKFRV